MSIVQFPVSRATPGVLALDGTVKRVGTGALSRLGYTDSKVMGMHILDLTHPDDRAATSRAVQRIKAGERVVFAKRYIGRGGRIVPAVLTCRMVYDRQSRPWYMVAQIESAVIDHAPCWSCTSADGCHGFCHLVALAEAPRIP